MLDHAENTQMQRDLVNDRDDRKPVGFEMQRAGALASVVARTIAEYLPEYRRLSQAEKIAVSVVPSNDVLPPVVSVSFLYRGLPGLESVCITRCISPDEVEMAGSRIHTLLQYHATKAASEAVEFFSGESQ